MAKKKYIPTITKDDFDGVTSTLRAELEKLYDEAKEDNAKPPLKASVAGAFDHLPDLDSKTVAKWSSTFKKYTGCDLDPALIRRGGYNSFDDLWKDMEVKLRNNCPDSIQLEPPALEVRP